jgi:hypothetical protein
MRAFLGAAIILVGSVGTTIPSSWGNDACDRAQVNSFHVQFSHGKFAGNQRDFCVPNSVPEEIQHALLQVALLNQKIAAFFQISPSQLLPNGVAVSLSENSIGSLDSDFSEGEIHLGVFSDWKGEDFDSPTYVHEFGHFLVHKEGGALSPFAKELASYGLYSEGLPDTLALAITGRVQGAEGLPACFSTATRELGSDNSFLADQEFFSGAHSTRAWGQCCVDARKSGPTPERLNHACEEIDNAVSRLSAPSMPSFTPAFCSVLPWDIDGCSPHQLGTPVNSFLLDLSVVLAKPDLKFYFVALSSTSAQTKILFSCRGGEKSAAVEVTEAAPDGAFRFIRSELNDVLQAKFDQLWKEHDLDLGMSVGRDEARQQAVADATTIFQRRISLGKSGKEDQVICAPKGTSN